MVNGVLNRSLKCSFMFRPDGRLMSVRDLLRRTGPATSGDASSRMQPWRFVRLALVTGTALTVANCSSTVATRNGRVVDSKYGVVASPKVIADGEPIPKGGGREMIGKPYVVAGRTYVPVSGKGYTREGWASWYGTAFHGRLTANGEIFDRESVAAASPTLPLPSYVRVTNTLNKRSMIVRVNDRGPYEQGRLIDVSERAADALGFQRRGTSRVRVEYLGKASTRGSDDAKLLATLRTDGQPAPFGRSRGPIMFADLRGDLPEATPPRAPAPAPIRLADATPIASAGSDDMGEPLIVSDADPAPRATLYPQPRPSVRLPEPAEDRDPAPMLPPQRPRESSAAPAPPSPAPARVATRTEMLPPHRPVLSGIY